MVPVACAKLRECGGLINVRVFLSEPDATVFFFCSISGLVDESVYDEAMDLVSNNQRGHGSRRKSIDFWRRYER